MATTGAAARPTRRVLPVIALGLSVTACGTTVPLATTGPAAGTPDAGGGLGAPSPVATASGGVVAPGATVAGGTTAGGAIVAPAGSSGPAGAAATGTTAQGPASPFTTTGRRGGVQGPGVTPTRLSIGVLIADDAKAANAALGAGAVTHGDEASEYRAKVADINAHGGIAGRKVDLVEFHYDITSGESTSSLEQAACAYFTQDHPVAAVVNVALTDTGLSCLTQKGVAVLGNSLSYATDQTYAKFPRFVEPLAMSLTRMVRNYAAGMSRLGFLDGTVKIGLVTPDNARFRRAGAQLDAALAPYGRKLDDVAYVKDPQQESELSQESADTSSAVLNFRSHGITNVMFLDPSGVSELLFMNNAESQHYRPRYGFGQSEAAALRSAGVPAAQFVNSVTVGWFPRLDGVPANQTMYPQHERRCLALFAKHGIQFDSDDARRHADDICDTFDVLATALAAPPTVLDADTIIAAIRAMPAVPGSGTYRLSVTAHRPDGVDLVRDSVYVAGCDCWHYRGGLRKAL